MDICETELIRREFDQNEIRELYDMPESLISELETAIGYIYYKSNKNFLISALKTHYLSTEGNTNTLQKRLIQAQKKKLFALKDLVLSEDLLPYYVVIDFEATCNDKEEHFSPEIIEFPAVLVNSKKQKVVDTFQRYCKPKVNPILSDFCKELTGIAQEQVDSAESFEVVLNQFNNWLAFHKLGYKYKYAVVTDGPFDMKKFLHHQCKLSNVKYPKWGLKWFNIKTAFSKFYLMKNERMNLTEMLQYLNMDLVGNLHCGLADAKNIARVLLRMMYHGASIQVNEAIIRTPNTGGLNDSRNEEEESSMKKLKMAKHIPIHRRSISFNEALQLKAKLEQKVIMELFANGTNHKRNVSPRKS